MRCRKHQYSAGFTLVEVLVAAAVLGLALATLLSALSLVSRSKAYADEGRRVEDWLFRHVAEQSLRVSQAPGAPVISTPSGIDAAGGTVTDTYTPTATAGLYQLTSTINYTDNTLRSASYSISTYLYLSP